MNPFPRNQLTIFDAPIINTDEPLHIGDPRLRPIPWNEALDQLIALGNALNSKKELRHEHPTNPGNRSHEPLTR